MAQPIHASGSAKSIFRGDRHQEGEKARLEGGSCGGVDLSRVKCAAILDWPKALHEGHGQGVFIVEPTASEKQNEALGQLCTGKLGGMPWELLGPTFEVKGLVKAKISIEGRGPKSVFRAEGKRMISHSDKRHRKSKKKGEELRSSPCALRF